MSRFVEWLLPELKSPPSRLVQDAQARSKGAESVPQQLPQWAIDHACEWLDGPGGAACVASDQRAAVQGLAELLVKVSGEYGIR